MTENEIVKQAIRCIVGACDETCKGYDAKESVCHGYSEVASGLETVLKNYEQYRAIGTVEEFKDLKEKNTPMELAEHNFQDEVHHYLCPSCRSIVSCNQNYCEECGQALET